MGWLIVEGIVYSNGSKHAFIYIYIGYISIYIYMHAYMI